jgi:hypothetical protein
LAERAATRRDRRHHISLCILNALHFLNAGRQNHNAFLMAIRWAAVTYNHEVNYSYFPGNSQANYSYFPGSTNSTAAGAARPLRDLA